jgi:hypothetical protein
MLHCRVMLQPMQLGQLCSSCKLPLAPSAAATQQKLHLESQASSSASKLYCYTHQQMQRAFLQVLAASLQQQMA